jgi:hypothetical protein
MPTSIPNLRLNASVKASGGGVMRPNLGITGIATDSVDVHKDLDFEAEVPR